MSGLEAETAIEDMTSHEHSNMSFSCLKLHFSLFPVHVCVYVCVHVWVRGCVEYVEYGMMGERGCDRVQLARFLGYERVA